MHFQVNNRVTKLISSKLYSQVNYYRLCTVVFFLFIFTLRKYPDPKETTSIFIYFSMFMIAVCPCSCPYVFCFHVRSHVKYSFLCPQLSTDMDADVDFDSYKIGDRAQDIDMKFSRIRGHRHRRGQTTG